MKLDIHDQVIEFFRGKVLDIGFVAHPLTQKIPELYGVDIQQVEKPDNYTEIKTGVNLNTDPIPYDKYFFDTVFVGETIEHMSNPIKFLSECNRVLKKDGLLILTTPNPHYYIHILENIFLNKFKAFCSQHINNFTRLTMRAILEHGGFELDREIGTIVHLPIISKKIRLSRFPSLTDSIIYICKKTDDFEGHFIDLDRPYNSDMQKEFRIDAKIF